LAALAYLLRPPHRRLDQLAIVADFGVAFDDMAVPSPIVQRKRATKWICEPRVSHAFVSFQ